MNGNLHRFVIGKPVGVCPCCDKKVYDDQLYVEEQTLYYHLSCYNLKKAQEQEDNE